MLLNIQSYAGGSNLWGAIGGVERETKVGGTERAGAEIVEDDADFDAATNSPSSPMPAFASTSASQSQFHPPSMCDGLIEVIGVWGAMHLGRVQLGLDRYWCCRPPRQLRCILLFY